MHGTGALGAAGQGEVDEAAPPRGPAQKPPGILQGGLDMGLEIVDDLAGGGAVGGRQVAKVAQQGRQKTGASTEIAGADLLQGGGVARPGQITIEPSADVLDTALHDGSSGRARRAPVSSDRLRSRLGDA